MKEWVTMYDAAKLLKVSTKTIQRRVKDGTYKSRKNGQVREVAYANLGLPDSIEQKPVSSAIDHEQAEFLKEVIRNQQKHIESQDERISEVNKLILGIQGQVTQLNQNLQLATNQASKDIESITGEGKSETTPITNSQLSTDSPVLRGDTTATQEESAPAVVNDYQTHRDSWRKLNHFDRYQNIYLIITITLVVIMTGLIAWQVLS
ncbi:MAG: hypothetical protein WCG48_02675 [Candidatus Berkelbacteria bacterium]